MRLTAFALLLLAASAAYADPRPGLYRLEASTLMPNIEGAVRALEADVCISGPPFPVLGAAGAFGGCAAVKLRGEGSRLTYALTCEGRGAARGMADYEVGAESYRGRVEITMGGKSMTMTERQSATRLGDCPE